MKKKRVLSLLLSVCMALSLLPAAARAAAQIVMQFIKRQTQA